MTDIGRIGIWTFHLEMLPAAAAQDTVAELDGLGYGAVWIPEAVGREAFTQSALLLAGAPRIAVATGVAQIWGRDPMAANAAHRTLSEAYPDRFLLGLGVSHAPMVAGMRGHDYAKPYSAMKAYLDAMDAALYLAAQPTTPPTRVLAALRPRMLRLAGERAAGAHTYFVPPEHTAHAREIMGPDALLAVEQAVVLETDPTKARETARLHTQIYVGLPNYQNNVKQFGITDDDFADRGSDRLVDAIVAWGDLDAVRARVQAHFDAGANHVCLQVAAAIAAPPPMDTWRELAAAFV